VIIKDSTTPHMCRCNTFSNIFA